MSQNTRPFAPRRTSRTKNMGVRRHRVISPDAPRELVRSHDVMQVTTVAHRFLSSGAVILADVPYADGAGRKCRPVVVVAVHGHTVTVIPCTSSKRASARTDIAIEDLAAAGLPKATKARTARHLTLERFAVVKMLGHLGAVDAFRILHTVEVA